MFIIRRLILVILFVVITSAPAHAFNLISGHGYKSSAAEVLAVCPDGAGGTYAAGYFYGSLQLPGQLLTGVGQDDAFIVHCDDTGQVLWALAFGDAEDQRIKTMGLDSSGNLVVAGDYSGTLNLGGGDLPNQGSNTGMFIGMFDPSGSHMWSQAWYGSGTGTLSSLAVNDDDNIAVAGHFSGSIDFGDGPETAVDGQDIFLAILDNHGLAPAVKTYGGVGNQQARGVAIDTASNMVLTGWNYGSVDFGGGPLDSFAGQNCLLAKFNKNHGFVFANQFGGAAGWDQGTAVACDENNDIIMIGTFAETIDFGGGAMTKVFMTADFDGFIVKFSASGTFVWEKQISGPEVHYPTSVVAGAGPEYHVAGIYQGELYAPICTGSFTSGTNGWVSRIAADGTCIKGMEVGDWVFSLVVGHRDGSTVLGGWFLGDLYLGSYHVIPGSESGAFLATYTDKETPNVLTPIPDLEVGENSPDYLAYVDLRSHFDDPESTNPLEFTIFSVGNPDLVTAAVTGVFNLDLSFALNQSGESQVTVEARNEFGATVLASFTVVVTPLPDAPALKTVLDVPNDQGRQVRVGFRRSGQDEIGAATPILNYEIYRRIDLAKGWTGPVFTTSSPGSWERVATVSAHGDTQYFQIASTLADSTVDDGVNWSVFLVRAATALPLVFFDSAPDSGYSVDNLAPTAPLNLMVDGDIISWDESMEPDFNFFTVYASNNSILDESAEILGHTVGTSLVKEVADYAYYHLTATDFSGNEGAPATFRDVSGVPGARPLRTSLRGNFPNPFNPSTVIVFDLARDMAVRLQVFDVAGRMVRRLDDGTLRPAGRNEASWDGCDQRGHASPAGVYFYKLEVEDYSATKRMLLVK